MSSGGNKRILQYQRQGIANGDEWKVVSAGRARMKFYKVPTADSSGGPCSNYFSVLSDKVVETVEHNIVKLTQNPSPRERNHL